MDRFRRERTRRAVSAFLASTGGVLMMLAVALAVRDWLMPPRDTWPAWTGTTTVILLALAIALWTAGALLLRRGHQAARDTVRTFLTGEERDRVVAAIRALEKRTSGEIRVHLQDRTDEHAREAARVFDRLGMSQTRERNGVLFFIAVRHRRFAVIGDAGIHAVVPGDFWSGVVSRVESRFAEGRFADGLLDGITMAGNALAEFFPHRPDDPNELDDRITGSPRTDPE
jgi:uncharacterized membrane protein